MTSRKKAPFEEAAELIDQHPLLKEAITQMDLVCATDEQSPALEALMSKAAQAFRLGILALVEEEVEPSTVSRFLRVMSFDEASEAKFWKDVAGEIDGGFNNIDFAETDQISASTFWRTAVYVLIKSGAPYTSTELVPVSEKKLRLIDGGKE